MSTAKCQNPGSGGYNPIFKGEKILKKWKFALKIHISVNKH